MSTLKRKFELLSKLQSLGFTFEEAQQLRRISMTLSKWAEAECNGEIERDEATGKPYRNVGQGIAGAKVYRYPVADREAGALKRLKAIILARNTRECMPGDTLNLVTPYHQSDPRGCALYLVKASDLPEGQGETVESILSRYYTRGLAVCA